ncbi:aquaporin-8-like [Clavelina lepadiformis]|uniref:aquaporin-8-like n=1 Tax=Clavelina lepadiformis TaxID=159417 RepID=UPI0040438A21
MRPKSEIYEQWVRPLIAEFFGQLIFAFLHSSTGHSNIAGTALAPAISDGLTVTILVITIGHISGAHVNFAVTTAVFVGGGIKWMMVPLYLIAQLLGSLAGAGLAYATNGGASGAFALGAGVSVGQGILMEVILTAMLTLSVVLAAVELNADLAALAIGFSILIDILAGFTVSGGCMNPTLSFGPAVVAGAWTNYWVYWVGPLLGAIFSGIVFRLFLGGKARLLFRQETSAPTEQGMERIENGHSTEKSKGSNM